MLDFSLAENSGDHLSRWPWYNSYDLMGKEGI